MCHYISEDIIQHTIHRNNYLLCSVLPDATEALGIPSTTFLMTLFVKDFRKV